MVKTNDPRLPTELPTEFLSRLDPKLAELYSQLPSDFAFRISVLVREAPPRRIHPNRVLIFAYLYTTVERSAQSDAVSKEHSRRAKLELAGEIQGFQTGYRDDVEAKRRYRDGRNAQQQIKRSLEAVVRRWRVFEQVAQRHRSELPVHLQLQFSNTILRNVGTALNDMGIAAVIDKDDLASERGSEKERSATAQAYILWCSKVAPYRGKWNDMYQLASVWRMSSAKSVKGFITVVTRICKGAVCTRPLPDSWESILSDKI